MFVRVVISSSLLMLTDYMHNFKIIIGLVVIILVPSNDLSFVLLPYAYLFVCTELLRKRIPVCVNLNIQTYHKY